ncbi:hypothetical protein [Propionicicella superfundia]|uniref:hypothetical protein n=1 Tax=Propionicicella superfundia TaxID=348582 RepID=UPI00048E1E37|nr:hypothetical protein [Propionicicella superfundia]
MDDTDPLETDRVHPWFLNSEELAATRAKVAKLQQRAVRKGFTGRIELAAVPASRSHQSAGGLPVTEHGFDVTITGEPPRYQGWRFVAAVDAVDGGTVLRYPPGNTATIGNDQIRAGECDHCHTTRDRRSTVLVAHDDTGQVLQVGRSCLKDFLGHNVLPVFLTDDEVRASLGAFSSGGPAAWDVHSVLTYAAAAVEAFGWTPASASEHGRVPTRDVVRLALTGGRGADQLRDQLAPHLSEATARSPQIRTDLLAGLVSDSGYEANLATVLRGEAVEARHLGLAVSAITAHQRLIADQARETTRREATATVDYAGTVGEKVTLTGTVRTAMRVDGFTYRSPEQVLLVVDCGTAVAKMTTASAWAYPLKVGDPLTVTGTVKAHTEWNGIKQTVLTRPKKHDPLPMQAPLADATPRLWETVTSPRLDGAAAALNTTTRTPAPGVAPAR